METTGADLEWLPKNGFLKKRPCWCVDDRWIKTPVGAFPIMPQRIQLRRIKGWRMPPNTVKVDRSTPFGNPFAGDGFEREDAVALFRAWICGELSPAELSGFFPRSTLHHLLATRMRVFAGLRSLRGKDLACWCPLPAEGEPDVCHAAVLLELANREETSNDGLRNAPPIPKNLAFTTKPVDATRNR